MMKYVEFKGCPIFAKIGETTIIGHRCWNGKYDITTPELWEQSIIIGSVPDTESLKKDIVTLLKKEGYGIQRLPIAYFEEYHDSGRLMGWCCEYVFAAGDFPDDLTEEELVKANLIIKNPIYYAVPLNNSIAVMARELMQSYAERHKTEIEWFI